MFIDERLQCHRRDVAHRERVRAPLQREGASVTPLAEAGRGRTNALHILMGPQRTQFCSPTYSAATGASWPPVSAKTCAAIHS